MIRFDRSLSGPFISLQTELRCGMEMDLVTAHGEHNFSNKLNCKQIMRLQFLKLLKQSVMDAFYRNIIINKEIKFLGNIEPKPKWHINNVYKYAYMSQY